MFLLNQQVSKNNQLKYRSLKEASKTEQENRVKKPGLLIKVSYKQCDSSFIYKLYS